MTVDKNLTIDLNRVQPQKVIRIHEGDIDSVRVVIKLTEDNTALTLSDITVKYDAVIAGHLAEEDAEADVSDDAIIVPVTENMTKLNGLLQIDVKIIEDSSVLFTQTISLLVDRAVINDDTIIDISGTTIGEKFSSIEATLETKADSASVYTKTQTDTMLASKADKWQYLSSIDLDDITDEGNYYFYATNVDNAPTTGGYYWHIEVAPHSSASSTWRSQIAIKLSTGETYLRYYTNSEWGSWSLIERGNIIDSTPTEGSTNAVTSGAVYEALQDGFNVDTEVTEDSTNAVTSGAVYTALQDKADKWHAPYGDTEDNSINLDEITEEGNYTFYYGYGYVSGELPSSFPTDSGWWILINAKISDDAIAQILTPISALSDTSNGIVIRYARIYSSNSWHAWQQTNVSGDSKIIRYVASSDLDDMVSAGYFYATIPGTNSSNLPASTYGTWEIDVEEFYDEDMVTQKARINEKEWYREGIIDSSGTASWTDWVVIMPTISETIEESSSNLVTSGAVYSALEEKASVENGSFSSYAWYAGDSTKTIVGTYQIIGDYIFITATAYRIADWGVVYYTLPATPVGACASTAFESDTNYTIQTNTLTSSGVSYPVVQIRATDGSTMTEGTIMFTMTYKVS